jgi:hypothetical protein
VWGECRPIPTPQKDSIWKEFKQKNMAAAKTPPPLPSDSRTTQQMCDVEKMHAATVVEMPVQIFPNTFYRPAYVRDILGVRYLNHLTKAGLRAYGGWYTGEAILEFARRVWQDDPCQRESARKEAVNAELTTKKKSKAQLEKNSKNGKIYPVPRRHNPDALLSQMDEVGS